MITEKYTNRYGDKFLYTLQEDGNIMWTGKYGRPFWRALFNFRNEAYGEDYKRI